MEEERRGFTPCAGPIMITAMKKPERGNATESFHHVSLHRGTGQTDSSQRRRGLHGDFRGGPLLVSGGASGQSRVGGKVTRGQKAEELRSQCGREQGGSSRGC